MTNTLAALTAVNGDFILRNNDHRVILYNAHFQTLYVLTTHAPVRCVRTAVNRAADGYDRTVMRELWR